jgi:hypothetical protein
MRDRVAWLGEWCVECGAAPGVRFRSWGWSPGRDTSSVPRLHVARGWRMRPCPTCKAAAGELCETPSGREALRAHVARLRAARWELSWQDVWEELERRGALSAVVPFAGRAGRAGQTGTIRCSRIADSELVYIERWSSDELVNALEAPIWDRYGTFAGQPWIRVDVVWTVEERPVVIVGRRGDRRFEEIVG